MYSLPVIYGAAPTSLKWSPDGKTLAFLWNADGDLRMDVFISRAGEDVRRLTDAGAVGRLPAEDDETPVEEIEYAQRMYGGVSQFDWSPDGHSIAFLCRGDLFLADVDSGAVVRLTQSAAGRSNLQFSPDGARVGFVMNNNVWAHRLQDGALTQLTFFTKSDLWIERWQWSPDGKRLALCVQDGAGLDTVKMPDYSPLKEVKINEFKRDNVGRPVAKTRIGIVSADGGKILRCKIAEANEPEYQQGENDTGNLLHLNQLAWTPDGKKLIVLHRSRDYKIGCLSVVDADGDGTATELHRETQEPWFRWHELGVSPDGQYAYFQSYASGRDQVYRVALAGGAPECVTPGDYDVETFVIPKRGAHLYFHAWAPQPQELSVFRAPLAGGEAERVSPTEYACAQANVSEDETGLAFVCSKVMTPPVVLRMDDGEATLVVSTARPEFAELEQPICERFTFVNESDGATIHARLMKPANFDPSRKYPVVLSCVYAGQGKDAFGRYQALDAYMANEMGYIVVGVDLRSSSGYGADFAFGYHKQLGLIDSDELASAARHMRSLPYVDAERIGLWGGSYGGFLTLMVMTRHPGVFHTGVSWKPVTDWRNYNDAYTRERLTLPADNPDIYEATSPVFHADKLEGNLLLVHGMLDDNVLFQDCVWMVQKLIEAGKYFDLAIYPRDDHGFTRRHESLPDLMERMAAYFEEHMGLGPID